MKLLLHSMILMLLTCNCASQKKGNTHIESTDNLIGEWVHSHEEDQNDYKVFRLSDYDFPPSRGREKIYLFKDGKLKYTPIAANDLHQSYSGEWYVKDRSLILEYEDEKKTFEIIETNESTLKVK